VVLIEGWPLCRCAADAVGQHDAVDAILQIGVFVADVQFAAGGGVLRYARRLQQDLVESRIGALWERLDRLVIDLIRIGADRRHDAAARVVELLVLPRDRLRLGLRRHGGCLAALPRDDARLGWARWLRAPWRHDFDLRECGDAGLCGRRRRCGRGRGGRRRGGCGRLRQRCAGDADHQRGGAAARQHGSYEY